MTPKPECISAFGPLCDWPWQTALEKSHGQLGQCPVARLKDPFLRNASATEQVCKKKKK